MKSVACLSPRHIEVLNYPKSVTCTVGPFYAALNAFPRGNAVYEKDRRGCFISEAEITIFY